MKRVAVTGIGMVTPLGLDTASSWDGFASGRSGVRRIEAYDPTGEKVVVAAEVSKSDAEVLASALPADVRDRTARFTHFAVAAAQEALALRLGLRSSSNCAGPTWRAALRVPLERTRSALHSIRCAPDARLA